jgi:protein involved in polysaccharide export with SLBB domain
MKVYSILVIILLCASLKLNAQSDNNIDENYLSGMPKNNFISVTIGGSFIVTGTFPASINERVDQFLTRMFNQGKEKLMSTTNTSGPNSLKLIAQVKKEIANYSFRHIKLKRFDGTETFLDIEKFRINGDFKNNPYLKNDDVLIFPPADLDRNFFSITGAVNKSGVFYFVDGDKLSDAIEFAGGINKAYENVNTAEINRLSYDGRNEKVETVNIQSDLALQRGDRIVIIASETMKKDFSVMIIGEVNSPGVIPITKDRTTLSEVIKKAGGFTNSASLKHSKLYTGNSLYSQMEKQYISNANEFSLIPDFSLSTNLVQIEQLRMLRMSNLVIEDSAYFNIENQYRVLMEGSNINFSKLNDPNSEASKYLVKDNDIIVIPAKDSSVYVFGQVPLPGHVTYLPGNDYKYYIEKAGGYGDFAEKSDVMIIKGASSNWVEAENNTIIEEGDYIYVPKKILKSFNTTISQVGTYLGIVGSAATVILLLLQFKK